MEAAPGTVPSASVPGSGGLCCSCCQQQERESILPGWFRGVCLEKQAKPAAKAEAGSRLRGRVTAAGAKTMTDAPLLAGHKHRKQGLCIFLFYVVGYIFQVLVISYKPFLDKFK